MISQAVPAPAPVESDRFFNALALERQETPQSKRLARWFERAAVLAWFEPHMVGAPDNQDELLEDEDWIDLITDSEIARTAHDGPRRRLTLAKRREALAGLKGREGVKKALLETKDRPSHDPLQQALDRLIEGKHKDIGGLAATQPELYALHTASTWLNGLLDGIPDLATISLRLRREELLQPHRLLAGPGFVGRQDELDDLRNYVQEVRTSRIWKQALGSAWNLARRVLDQPPLVIFGPGGVGKSTLVAQFVLEHAAAGLMFVDLDFGRPNLDPRQPVALLAEAARQIATQAPSKLSEGDMLAADLDLAAASATQGSLESQHVVDLDEAVRRFCHFATSALPRERKVPVILDTFEEVEALGQTRVDSVWDLLRRLQTQLPQLRPVICSRIPPPASLALFNLPLRELEQDPATQYLDARLRSLHNETLPTGVIYSTVSRITRTPLALNLAAELLIQAVRAGQDPASVVAQIKGNADEAFLYSRILKQITETDVQRLATPGLVVRRLDSDVVLKVLARPCGVEVADRAAAQDLLNRLAGQAALVERQADGSLLHRADVRRQMLPAIEQSEGREVVREIDRAAAEHYRGEDIGSRTERAYHLLRLGDLGTAQPLLTNEVAQRLPGALDELPPDARLELGLRLGITPGPDELRTADQVRWERGAGAAALDLLASGDYERVLALLRTGPGRRTGGPLDRIEAEALIGMGDWSGALQVAQSGLAAAQRAGERASALELSLIMARIGFATTQLEIAADALDKAETLTIAADPAETRLRTLTASLRLARLRDASEEVEKIAQRARELLAPRAVARLSPSVLRELAGELASDRGNFGEAAGSILRTALSRLGIEQKTPELIEGLASTISGWLAAGGPGAFDVQRVLSGISGAPPVPKLVYDQEAWQNWLRAIPGSRLGSALATLLRIPGSGMAEPHTADLQKILAQYMRDAAGVASARNLAGQRVVLLSDGTGNSTRQIWRTNVWRMFEALDLTYSRQVAIYSDGTGTSSTKWLAILFGALGLGLKRDVIELYEFACRTYRSDNDEIFAFGFGRGAFTIRVVVGLICSQGLVRFETDDELHTKAKAAYRAYRRENFRTNWRIEAVFRALRDLLVFSRYNKAENKPVNKIRFLGLWDTVAAYSLPIEEMTRGVSQWLFPLELPGRRLSDKVQRACHALALDDERSAFHPILWTERGEKLAPVGKDGVRYTKDERISQVWFAGVHSNVGGGYPDDALAFIPLDWIMSEAKACGLVFKTSLGTADADAITRVKSARDKHGRLYDSRKGMGAYYRYGPRKISDLCNMRFSRNRDDKVEITIPKIHETALMRVGTGTRTYAPIGIPAEYEVVTEDGKILSMEQNSFETPAQARVRANAQERVWNLVWARQIVFFLTVIASIYLLTYPLTSTAPAAAEFTTPLRPLSDVIRMVGWVLPGAALRWTNAYAREPHWFLLCAGLVGLLLWLGQSLKGRITDQVRLAWRASLAKVELNQGSYRTRDGKGAALIAISVGLALIALYPVPGWVGYNLPKAPSSLQIFIDRITHPYFQWFAFAILFTMWLPDSTIARFRLADAYRQFITSIKLEVAPTFFALFFLVGGFAFVSHYLFNLRDSFGHFCQPVDKPVALEVCDPDDMKLCKRASDGSLPSACTSKACRGFTFEFDTASLCTPSGVMLERGGNYRFVLQQHGAWSFFGAPSSPGGIPLRAFLPQWNDDMPEAAAALGRFALLAAAYPLKRTLDRPFGRVIIRYGEEGNEENFIDGEPQPDGRLDETFRATRNGQMFVYLNRPVSGVFPNLFRNVNSGKARIWVYRIPR